MSRQNEMMITHTDVDHQPETWPAKNRKPESLPVLVIQILSGDGTEEFDPNSLIIQMVDDRRHFLPLADERSELSGKPAIIYRCLDLELKLSPPELRRMVLRDLHKKELFTLLNRHGMAWEWHEDFYDPVSGAALQPAR